ncbi:hypothetical protein GALL_453530 [mine drainage metagenome]|uniref:Uncharacterized protein n=1 Tax=mine drainage metagenome TaxID=410659 RepID=A0A1J5PYW9_9ZZZZ
MSRFDESRYGPPTFANGMRLPPITAARRVGVLAGVAGSRRAAGMKVLSRRC